MTVQPLAAPAAFRSPAQCAGRGGAERAAEDFQDTGRLDLAAFAGASPGEVRAALATMPPAQRGALERGLIEGGLGGGLGGLLGGVVGGVTDTVAETTDAAIETPNEHCAEEQATASHVQSLDRLRAQGQLDALLSPYRQGDRPPADLASGVDVAPSAVEREDGSLAP
ncbi:hypothetical protein [Caulobacter hibisci]|uniref:Uncharacterized protein n=1 Tax=Caulobacter hibisci TaxID=2035993 RepID=A0ABS0SST3_9CAUL|nr:hypothetical protein [Caulobacter hibisci]MBI1682715.1 hypothetical protein [Caulobacter hibisci]